MAAWKASLREQQRAAVGASYETYSAATLIASLAAAAAAASVRRSARPRLLPRQRTAAAYPSVAVVEAVKATTGGARRAGRTKHSGTLGRRGHARLTGGSH